MKFLKSKITLFHFLVGLLVFILLYPKFPLVNVPGTFVAIRTEDFLILLLVMLWGFKNLKRIKFFFCETIYQSILLYWLVGLISVISAILITYSVSPHLGILHWLRRVEYMSLFFVAATTITSTTQVKILLKVLFVVNLIIIFYGFGQIFFQFPVVSTTNSEFSKGQILTLTTDARANSTFAGHYDLAVYLSIILIFLASFFFFYEKQFDQKTNYLKLLSEGKRLIFQKGLLIFSGLGTFALLGFTAARVSFVATVLALISTFWLMGRKILIFLLILATLATVAAVPELRHRLVATLTVNILGGGGPKYAPPAEKTSIFTKETEVSGKMLKKLVSEHASKSATRSAEEASLSADIAPGEPINTTELGVYRSTNIRLNVEWPRAIRGFMKNPILGTGYSSLNIATDNDFLRSLGEVGLLGTLSLGLVFFVLIKKYLSSYKSQTKFEKLFIIATLGAIFAYMATAFFIDVFEASKLAILFWIMLGVCWAVARDYEDSKDV